MTEASDPVRLGRMLGGPDTAWILERLRRRRVAGRPLTGIVTLASASLEQRRAVERLLGRRAGSGTSVAVSLDELDLVLKRSGAAPQGLDDVVALLIGAVPDRAAETAAWEVAVAPVETLIAERPEYARWRDWLASSGLLRRLAADVEHAGLLVRDVVQVLRALPATGVGLGTLAAATTGSAHGLDDGEPVATLVLAAARVLVGGAPTGDNSAAGRRTAWSAVGVHSDEVSSTALCLGIPGGADSPAGRMLAAATGEPAVLTLRALGREQIDLGVGTGLVFVCENPIVVASAADDLGTRCPPLVCLRGRPSTATVQLLDLLNAQGARFAYHGDFDWGGVAIANSLRQRLGWTPWRFDTAALEAGGVEGRPLTGRPMDATWDPRLRPTLHRRGTRLEEESVLPELLADLREHTESPTDRPSIARTHG